jgi:uncharacterized protein YndB with AHSA1/START domain
MAIGPQTTKTLRLSRTFDAPREAVFEAWTRPGDCSWKRRRTAGR